MALSLFTFAAFGLILALHAAIDAGEDRDGADQLVLRLSDELAQLRCSPLQTSEIDVPVDATGIALHVSINPELVKDQTGNNLYGLYRAHVVVKNRKGDLREVSEVFYQP